MSQWSQKELSFTFIQDKDFKDSLINTLYEKNKIELTGYLKNKITEKSMSVTVTISRGDLIDYLSLFNLN